MHNLEVAWALQELADLLEFKGEEYFKVRAYRRAAETIAGLEVPVEEVYRQGRLEQIPGIGKNIAAKIGELLRTGQMRKLNELRSEFPPELREIMLLPGIGPKRARMLYQQLGIRNLDDLTQAAREHRIRHLPGWGAKMEADIVRHAELIRYRSGRYLIGTAREIAEALLGLLVRLPVVERLAVVGSLRRWRETVGDIDLLIGSSKPDEVLQAAVSLPRVKVVAESEEHVRLQTLWNIEVEIIVVPPSRFAYALLHATGSKEHYRQLQELAGTRGLVLNRYGLFARAQLEDISAGNKSQETNKETDRDKDKIGLSRSEWLQREPLPAREESDIYRYLGLPFIPPELREGRGEITAAQAGKLPLLVELTDLRGDLHVHSEWSDGALSLEEIALEAKKRGYEYVAVTDHSRSLRVARGLSEEQLREQFKQIETLNEQLQGVRLLKGVEVDILPGGELDYPDELLAEADVVIASVHTAFNLDRETMTRRIISALKHPGVKILGHPTGRLLNQREPYAVDVVEVLKACACYGKAVEINSSYDRLDLNEENAARARDLGIPLTINTDAHDRKRWNEIIYGVAVARRAWLTASDILNTRRLPELLAWLRG